MKKRIALTIFFLLLFLLQENAEAQEQLDLSTCLDYALHNSPKLETEQLSQEKETLTLQEQKSSFLPQVDAFLNYHNYFYDLPTYIFPQPEASNLSGIPLNGPYPIQLGLPHNLNTGLEINQTIFDMKFFGNGVLNEHYQSYKDIKLSLVEEEVIYQVAVLFYQIVVNEERLKFMNLNLERLQKLQSVVKLQVEKGFAKQTDLDKLLVKTSNLQTQKNKLQSGINQQLRYLKLMMGMPQKEEISIQYEQDKTLSPAALSRENGQLLEEQMLSEQRELNKMHNRRINAAYYPRLQAFATFLFQAQRQQFNFFESGQDWYNIHQWGLRLTVPLMHGFDKKNKKEISEIVDAQLSYGLQQHQEQALLDFRNATSELEVARAEQAAQKENVDLAERIYRQSELSYEQGTQLLMDFLDSESTLRESKMIYATTVLDTRMAELKVLKATGKLKELINQ